MTVSFEICPEGWCGLEPTQYFADDENDKYHALFKQWSCSTVQAVSNVTVTSPAVLQQIVAITLFEQFTRPHASHFWEYLSGWGHKDFAFRELAFAILSFAAGQLYVDNPKRFYGHYRKHESDGYLIDRNESGDPKLMPCFWFGMPCARPGAWFRSIG